MGQNICIPSIFQINQAVTAGADIDDGSAVSGAMTIANGTTCLLANLVFQYSAPGTTYTWEDVFKISLNRASSSFYDGS